jgi:N-acyl-D-amino-acid deacylase
MRSLLFAASALLGVVGCGPAAAEEAPYDVLIKGGTVYDGTGAPGRRADVGLRGDTVAAVGDLSSARAKAVLAVDGLAVAPGFVNMLSWSTDTLLVDGRSQSEIRQGVTTEAFGEGWSMGPLDEAMKRRLKSRQGDLQYDVAWTTLAEYLAHLERRGVAPNVASFLGAATIREYVLGEERWASVRPSSTRQASTRRPRS